MEFVSARFGDGVDRGAAVPPEFGAVRVRLNRKLLDRVRIGERQRGIEVGILVFAAVQRVEVRRADAAVDGVAMRPGALVQGACDD